MTTGGEGFTSVLADRSSVPVVDHVCCMRCLANNSLFLTLTRINTSLFSMSWMFCHDTKGKFAVKHRYKNLYTQKARADV